MRTLDPWQDAATLAGRIASPFNRLIVVLGAEAWCARCRALKPVFMQIAEQAPERDIMLWLDIETHTDFIGDYLPESLPELLIYQGSRLMHHSVLIGKAYREIELDINADALRLLLAAPPPKTLGADPGIAQRLVQQDWAHGA